MSDVTQILQQIESGDPSAADQLLPLVYEELRKLAKARLASEKPGQTLQATALVHEAYLRLVGDNRDPPEWENRRHFFAAAAESMRRILVENARRKRRLKHGGKFKRLKFNDEPTSDPDFREDLLALDDALSKLAKTNPQAAELVQLRYFTGMTMKEVSVTLELSERTAARLWTYARAWLLREMSTEGRGFTDS